MLYHKRVILYTVHINYASTFPEYNTYASTFPEYSTCTVPTFNSCTKCVGIPGIKNDSMPDCYPVALALMYGWPYN